MTTQRNAQPGDDASAAAAPTAAPTPAEAAPADVPAGADCDSDRLRRAADELLRRGRAGLGMTETTARYRQLELAQLLSLFEHLHLPTGQAQRASSAQTADPGADDQRCR